MSFPRQSWFKTPKEILVKTTKSVLFWYCSTLLAVCTRRLKSSGTLPCWDASPGRIASPASFGKIMLMIWFLSTIWFHIKQWFYSVNACSLGTGFLNFLYLLVPFPLTPFMPDANFLFLCWFPTINNDCFQFLSEVVWMNVCSPGGIDDCGESADKKREALRVEEEGDQSARLGNLESK